MASKAERTVINAAGLVQGIVLVTFPAASTIFTDTSEYGLSSTQYGAMFLPQVALAITTSLLGAGLARRITTKRVYLLGLACSTDLDGAAAGQHAGQDRPGRRVPDAPGGHRVPGRRVRPDRPGAEHLHLGLQPRQRRPLGADAERAARAGHGAGTGSGGHLRRPGLLVGPSDRIDGAARGAARGQPAAAAAGRSRGQRPRAGPAGLPGPVLAVCGVRRAATASARR